MISNQSVAIIVKSEAETSSVLPLKLKQVIQQISSPVEVTIQSLECRDVFPADILCPLTLEIPSSLAFPGQKTYQHCRSLQSLRRTVAGWGYAIGEGDYWLPIVLTEKGPLYGEAIAYSPSGYNQPLHLNDATRQILYQLGYQLLVQIEAIPGVYLIQFGREEQPYFDRIIPFADTPTLASVGVQEPDLLVSYWYCRLGTPVKDLQIKLPSSGGT